MGEKGKEHNAADPVAVMDAERKNKNVRDQELVDIKDIVSTQGGMRFFRRLMAEGMIFTTTFRGNSQSFFLEGHRNLALKFLDDIAEAAPDKIADLMTKKEEDE